jgi:elongator complex protein 1
LFERREFRQAAAGKLVDTSVGLWLMFVALLVFTQAQNLFKAMLAHERALEWQELFDLAVRTKMAEGDMVVTGYRIAGLHLIHTVINDQNAN